MKCIQFDIINEPKPADKFSQLFYKNWPSYRAWYLDEGEEARPSYLECISALKHYMPELYPLYQSLVKQLDCDDLQARFLSLYCPPTFYSACSQLIYQGEETALIRNYDFPAFLCEGTIIKSHWLDKGVIATADCVWGVLDGINDQGLSVSINYGGSLIEGKGFGITIVMRYILEVCNTVEEAIAVLHRVPVHLDYNIALLDKSGNHATVFIAPGREPNVTQATISTNHQGSATAERPLFLEDTVTRLDALQHLLGSTELTLPAAVGAFLQPPLYRQHDIHDSGTLYTAVYSPEHGYARYVWPHTSLTLSFDHFEEQAITVEYGHQPI